MIFFGHLSGTARSPRLSAMTRIVKDRVSDLALFKNRAPTPPPIWFSPSSLSSLHIPLA